MNAVAENRVRRLAEALSAVQTPLAPLFEYAGDLEQHFTDADEIEISCIAALLRARAGAAKREIARYLEELEEAASRVAGA
ncbi:MAG TPA: hypothetical protein VFN37_14490 [Candidatus Baltobacteraceae bacterium]|nr:hypothetical protein [Candidatus Baltobacteraceae bacterium]